MSPSWEGAVSDGVWGLAASGGTMATAHDLSVVGKHTLKIWGVEPGGVVQKIIDLGCEIFLFGAVGRH